MRPARLEDASPLYGGGVLSSDLANENSAKTYLDAPHMAVRSDRRGVVLEIRGPSSSKDYRAGLEICLHAMEVTQATRLLMDLRKMRLVLVDDERWLARDLLPRLGATALELLAIVTPENALARVIVADLAKPRPTGAQSKHCESVEEAQKWLASPGGRVALPTADPLST
jgi:hypothetical protein